MNDYQGLSLISIKDIAKQMMEGLAFLKDINLIHTDLKLENILFTYKELKQIEIIRYDNKKKHIIYIPERIKIKLIDFGGATYEYDMKSDRIINTRQYRGPEVTLEIGLNDIIYILLLIYISYYGNILLLWMYIYHYGCI